MSRFTRLSLDNWRNFKRVEVGLGDRVFIHGPNASGKSNLLDVFRFLQELAVEGGGLTNALQTSNRGGIRAVRSLHAGANPRVRVEVDCQLGDTAWTYELELEATGTPQRPGPARVVKETVTKAGALVLERPDAEDEADPELLLATALEQRSANAGFRELRDFFRSTEYIHVVPQLVRAPVPGDQRRFGKGLGTGLIAMMGDVTKKQRDARLRRIQRGLKSVLPQFEDLEWFQDSRGVPHIRAKYKHWRPKGAWQQESSFSDGTLRLIGLLWFLGGSGGPLLLEEPELSLHPAAVRQIPRILANMNGRSARQVIMTSHSLEILDDRGIEPAEVLVLRPTGSETTVVQGSRLEELCTAAARGESLSAAVEALTRPEGVEALASLGATA